MGIVVHAYMSISLMRQRTDRITSVMVWLILDKYTKIIHKAYYNK